MNDVSGRMSQRDRAVMWAAYKLGIKDGVCVGFVVGGVLLFFIGRSV